MKSIIVYLLFTLSLLGVVDSSFLTYEHYNNAIPPCSLQGFSDCGHVLRSEYAIVAGIPVALWGVFYYISLTAASIGSIFNKKFFKILLLLISSSGFVISLYLIYLQLAVINAICLYCMFSGIISIVIFFLAQIIFSKERKLLVIYLLQIIYHYGAKPLLFKFDPEKIHNLIIFVGSTLFSLKIFQIITSIGLKQNFPNLSQSYFGIIFSTPIGLAAGFDYNAKLTQSLSPFGFGFQSVGTITNLQYEGNKKPRLGRLPKSKSLMVNKGFKNIGVEKIIQNLAHKKFSIPVGISIGRTNTDTLSQEESVFDIISAFEKLQKANLENSYYELNISCPNLKGKVTFYDPEKLSKLLKKLDILKIKKPVFIKMPIELSNEKFLNLLKIIQQHSIQGVIIGNLQKDRTNLAFIKDEVKKFPIGNFSGKPTFQRSNELIQLTYKTTKGKLLIIGCGGVFSAKDAYEKIISGATLIQMITGMVFEGPQIISKINFGVDELLRKNGFRNISEAVGTKIFTHAPKYSRIKK